MPFVEEINSKTHSSDVYFTSVNAAGPSGRNRITKTTTASGVRNNKRVNYSLSDLEAKIYAQKNGNEGDSQNSNFITTTNTALERYSPQELLKSRRRFMELDTENVQDIKDVSYLMSSVTGISKDRIDSSSGSGSGGGSTPNVNRSSRNKFELPKNMELMYRSTKPPVVKKKNTNRVVALKKTLASKRPLTSYLDALDQVNRSIIYHNVYNKKFFKVLPVITICSICGGYNSISGCVNCGNKICSLRCFNLHNDTRCNS
ncbi:LANO_0D03158g1_1 [Lachancea nothofagi CBS 11611]|uniref:LANO_0D03158g1_1 n=1 Tax=Lachancea nothofagi CBS 11611 TaxID=1266666 RepID=A0A1G4JEY4_9SACH|nr:LANO_0D03158g1_1 [Lachancea nothofagi CBS 11611]